MRQIIGYTVAIVAPTLEWAIVLWGFHQERKIMREEPEGVCWACGEVTEDGSNFDYCH